MFSKFFRSQKRSQTRSKSLLSRKTSRTRVPRFEPLEERRLLSINVAVVASGSGYDSGFSALRNQLSDDTYFDFNASLVQPSDVDTVAELDAYDAVVIGNSGHGIDGDEFEQFAPALRTWVEAGGGVVATGWTVYGASADTGDPVADINAIVPVNTSGGYGYLSDEILQPGSISHPITSGVSSFTATPYQEYSQWGAEPEATVLATSAGRHTVVVDNPGLGASVYLGPQYAEGRYETSMLRSGDPDRLLEQSVAWAAGDIRPPAVVSTTPADGCSIAVSEFDTMTVTFDEAVTSATAEDTANYRIMAPDGTWILVDSATLDASQTLVTLTFAPQTTEGTYRLYVGNISDLGGCAMASMSDSYANAEILLSNPYSNPLASAVADFNGDGQLDLMVHMYGSTNLVLYEGQPGGGFVPRGVQGLTVTAPIMEMVAADLNQDGLADLVVPDRVAGVSFFYGKSDGTLTSRQSVNCGGNVSSIDIGDIDGDGDLDIVAGGDFGITALLNNETDDVNSWGRFWHSGPRVWDLHIADITGDGIQDVVSGYFDDSGYVWAGNGAGNFTVVSNFTTATSEETALADIDGDGYPDLASGRRGATINYGTSASPYFGANQNIGFGTVFSTNISTVDLDGDGDLDLIKGGWTGDGTLYISYNEGSRTFSSQTIDLSGDNIQTIWLLQTPDVNDDGLPDIIGTCYITNKIFVLKSQNGVLAATFEMLPNEAPTDITLSNSTIAENEPIETVVGTFTTTDPDASDTHTYTLVSGTGDTDNGLLTVDAGQLKTAASFDFETQSSHSIRVRTTDSGGLTFEKELAISVADVDEIPPTVLGTSPSFATTGALTAGTTTLDIQFSEPVVGGDVASNFELRSLGADGLLGTADDDLVTLTASCSDRVTTLSFAALPESVYRLIVKDTIADSAGNGFDGDGDGAAGGERARDFVVSDASTYDLVSPNGFVFDPSIGGWGAGQLVEGTGGAFDGLNRLEIDNVAFEPAVPSVTLGRYSTSSTDGELDSGSSIGDLGFVRLGAVVDSRMTDCIGNLSSSGLLTRVQAGLIIEQGFCNGTPTYDMQFVFDGTNGTRVADAGQITLSTSANPDYDSRPVTEVSVDALVSGLAPGDYSVGVQLRKVDGNSVVTLLANSRLEFVDFAEHAGTTSTSSTDGELDSGSSIGDLGFVRLGAVVDSRMTDCIGNLSSSGLLTRVQADLIIEQGFCNGTPTYDMQFVFDGTNGTRVVDAGQITLSTSANPDYDSRRVTEVSVDALVSGLAPGDYSVGVQLRKVDDNSALALLANSRLEFVDFAEVCETPILDDNGQTVLTEAFLASNLIVHREITVPDTGSEDFARTVDVFEKRVKRWLGLPATASPLSQ